MSSDARLPWLQRMQVRLFLALACTFVVASLLTRFVADRVEALAWNDARYLPGVLCPDGLEHWDEKTAYFADTGLFDPDSPEPPPEDLLAPLIEQYTYPMVVDADGIVVAHHDASTESFDYWEHGDEQCVHLVEHGEEGELWRGFSAPLADGRHRLVLVDLLAWSPEEHLPNPPSLHDLAVLSNPESTPSERMESGGRLSAAATVLAVVALVLLVAWLLARWLTRPVVRLAEQACQPVTEDGRIEQPFTGAGWGEVRLLGDRLDDLRERVNGLVDDLQRADSNRRAWIAQVAHDLRTPLTALSACLDRLSADVATRPEADDLRDTVGTARLDLDRVVVMTEDLFEIARLEHAGDLHRESILPSELIRRTVRSLEPLAEEQGRRLQFEVSVELPSFSADGGRLTRALENLIRNALRFARDEVTVSARESGPSELLFEVTDDGPGLAQGSVSTLSELEASPRSDDSTGLGLKVVQVVAEVHGGRAGIENEPEGGARAWIALPVLDDTSFEAL
ncbi:MAG: HAMP domain-containing sensor histidine kinase [Acidobacteriota bacterium]